jgi:hypothetical protein
MEYTVHFQYGTRVGARSLHMVHVVANGVKEAIKLAKIEHAKYSQSHLYKLTRVDHYDEETGRMVIDY